MEQAGGWVNRAALALTLHPLSSFPLALVWFGLVERKMSNVLLILINGRSGAVSSRYVFHFKLRLVHFLPHLTRDSMTCVCLCARTRVRTLL